MSSSDAILEDGGDEELSPEMNSTESQAADTNSTNRSHPRSRHNNGALAVTPEEPSIPRFFEVPNVTYTFTQGEESNNGRSSNDQLPFDRASSAGGNRNQQTFDGAANPQIEPPLFAHPNIFQEFDGTSADFPLPPYFRPIQDRPAFPLLPEARAITYRRIDEDGGEYTTSTRVPLAEMVERRREAEFWKRVAAADPRVKVEELMEAERECWRIDNVLAEYYPEFFP